MFQRRDTVSTGKTDDMASSVLTMSHCTNAAPGNRIHRWRTVIIKSAAHFVMMVVIASSGCAKHVSEVIRIQGSTTIKPFIERAADVYSQSKKTVFSIKATGSWDGIDALIAGACDIAMCSMELSPEQLISANNTGVALKPFLFGYDVIVPIVNKSNPSVGLSSDQLTAIYTGTIRNWSILGWEDLPISLVERDTSSGTRSVWHQDVVPDNEKTVNVTICASNSAVLSYVTEHRDAIGYISAAYLNSEVKPLKLDGIAITKSDSLLTEYRLKRPLYLFVNEERFGSEVRSFITFLLVNDAGRRLLRETGFFSCFALAPLFGAGTNGYVPEDRF